MWRRGSASVDFHPTLNCAKHRSKTLCQCVNSFKTKGPGSKTEDQLRARNPNTTVNTVLHLLQVSDLISFDPPGTLSGRMDKEMRPREAEEGRVVELGLHPKSPHPRLFKVIPLIIHHSTGVVFISQNNTRGCFQVGKGDI